MRIEDDNQHTALIWGAILITQGFSWRPQRNKNTDCNCFSITSLLLINLHESFRYNYINPNIIHVMKILCRISSLLFCIKCVNVLEYCFTISNDRFYVDRIIGDIYVLAWLQCFAWIYRYQDSGWPVVILHALLFSVLYKALHGSLEEPEPVVMRFEIWFRSCFCLREGCYK